MQKGPILSFCAVFIVHSPARLHHLRRLASSLRIGLQNLLERRLLHIPMGAKQAGANFFDLQKGYALLQKGIDGDLSRRAERRRGGAPISKALTHSARHPKASVSGLAKVSAMPEEKSRAGACMGRR